MERRPKGSRREVLDQKLAAAERASYAEEYEEALALFEEVVQLDASDSRAWEGKAQVLAQLSRYAEAAACYEQALQTKSADATNWLERGRALREEGRLEEALPCLEEAVRLAPRLLVAHLELQEVTADLAWEARGEEEAPMIEVLGSDDRIPPHPTHMPALDASMRGGVTPGSVLMVTGMPGTFKTSLCFWILYQQCLWEGRRALFITLEQTKESLVRQMAGLGMDLEATAEHLRILDLTRYRREFKANRDPKAWLDTLRGRVERARKRGVQSVALDSLDALQDLASFKSRRDLFLLFEYLRSLDVTCFLTTERLEFVHRGRRMRVVDAADFLADGIVELSWRAQEDGELQRGLRVTKLRDRPHTTSLYHLAWEGGVTLTRALAGPRP